MIPPALQLKARNDLGRWWCRYGSSPCTNHALAQNEERARPRNALFYGARAIDEVFFLEDFLQLEKDFPNFHFHLALDRPDPKADAMGVKYTAGFIAPVMGDTYLKAHEAPEDIEYYLCGPPMMSKTVLDLARLARSGTRQ